MYFSGIRLAQGAELNNLQVPVGPELPLPAAEGELFYVNSLGSGGPSAEGLYVHNGTEWIVAVPSEPPVRRAGDTMTGFLTLHANPTSALHAATKGYVDAYFDIPGTGKVPDAHISLSSVAQHQAQLVIGEGQITNGSILARVADAETVTGAWTFVNPVTVDAPTADDHAATKKYVDDLVAAGLSPKAAVIAASTVALAATYYNGSNNDGDGATLTATTNGALSLDTVLPAVNAHVLIKDQVAKLQNGVYVVTATGSVSTPWVLTRRATENQKAEIPGAYVFVQDGSLAGSGWVMIVDDPTTFLLGVDDINVNQFSGATPLAGGLSTYIQYNEGGYLTGDADFTWSSITNSLLFGPAAFIRSDFNTTNRANRLSFKSTFTGAESRTVLQVLAPRAYATGNVAGIEYLAGEDTTIGNSVAALDVTVAGASDARAHFKAMPINSGVAPTLNLVVGAGTTDYALTAYPTTKNVRLTGGAFATDPGFRLQVDGETNFNGGARLGGAASRFRGDFTAAGTVADRHYFQSSTTNARTAVGAIPNGTSSEAGWLAYAASTPTAATPYIAMLTGASEVRLESGSTSPAPIIVSIGTSPTERARFDTVGNFIVGPAALSTTATDGFVYTSAMPGGPSNAPTTYAGRVPMVFDSTNYKLFAYMGAQWREVGAAPIGSGFTFQATPPLSPSPGDRWIDSDTATEYTYVNDGNSTQWIETGGGSSVETIPQNEQVADYILTLNDAGKHLLHPGTDTSPRTFTIPANSSVEFPIGAEVIFVNQHAAGTLSIAITTDTLRLAGSGATGTRTLAANGIARALKIRSTEWIISGTGLT